ncbi:hypothetical protein J8L86_14625 [Shewanella sp. MMG014]|uniref:hypothetical protein n=1 Tax=Shewanella sp. MMG014 TaxID=2822691 RepID=UPI001B3698E2|nr:hypothetical protein [Shewanella sp. MMG014]MBQ4891088.1 hypothetical protein [Shewanella sp. MMG014]
MKYLRTNLATDWKLEKSLSQLVIEKVLWFIPKANPDYESKLHLVKEWLIEFDDNDLPKREIGLDKNGDLVLSGPNSNNDGFWLDTNMKYQDIKGKTCTPYIFSKTWRDVW